MYKDVTVSKLSKLQKQILMYARRAMLTKEQKIEEPTDSTICMRAPEWLSTALTQALIEVYRSRKIFHLGGQDLLGVHDWFKFFEEVAFVERKIEAAAKEAGIKQKVILTQLYKLVEADHPSMLWEISVAGKMAYHPWPYHDEYGWNFRVDARGMSRDQVLQSIKDMSGDVDNVWVTQYKIYPVNCTVPELLRDLFNFPVQKGGHIDALAFAPKGIGLRRYNAAQAALRRACSRLKTRQLVESRSGQYRPGSLFFRHYERTGIGLTEKGIAVADKLLEAENQSASPDLGLSILSEVA